MEDFKLATIEMQLQLIYPSMVKDYYPPVYVENGDIRMIYCLSKDGTWGSTWINEYGFNRSLHYFMLKTKEDIDSFIDKNNKGLLNTENDFYITGIEPFKLTLYLSNLLGELSRKSVIYKKPLVNEIIDELPIIKEISFWKKIKNKIKNFINKWK